MTKRIRTPPPSPPLLTQVPFQIPTSLQTLSVLSRELAKQSNRLPGSGVCAQSAPIAIQQQGLDESLLPPPAASSESALHPNSRPAFRASARQKQPSFPQAQTWVEPTSSAAALRRHGTKRIEPSSEPSHPQEQPRPSKRRPQVRPRPPVTPVTEWVPPPTPEGAIIQSSEQPPSDGKALSLDKHRHQIAALIAQKRAANEANNKREAWTRKALSHRVSQTPGNQLLDELNQAIEPVEAADSLLKGSVDMRGNATPVEKVARGRVQNGIRQPEQYASLGPAPTFASTVPATEPSPSSIFRASTTPTSNESKVHPARIISLSTLMSNPPKPYIPSQQQNRHLTPTAHVPTVLASERPPYSAHPIPPRPYDRQPIPLPTQRIPVAEGYHGIKSQHWPNPQGQGHSSSQPWNTNIMAFPSPFSMKRISKAGSFPQASVHRAGQRYHRA